MCIRDSTNSKYLPGASLPEKLKATTDIAEAVSGADVVIMGCLLYTSDAADERSSVDLGGRRIIKKKTPLPSPGDRPSI